MMSSTSSSMWNPYQPNNNSSTPIYTSSASPSTSSESSSSPNTSSSEKLFSRSHQQTPLSIPTPECEQDQQQIRNESDTSDTSSLDPSTLSYRSPSNSFSNYNYNSAYQQNFSSAPTNYGYFNEFQSNYYSNGNTLPQVKQEFNYYSIDSQLSKPDDKHTPPPQQLSSSQPANLPLNNITNSNTVPSFPSIHTHNPYAAFNNYYNMNYYHHHQQYFPNPIHFNNAYMNREQTLNTTSSPPAVTPFQPVNQIKKETIVPRPNLPVPTISDSNISCSYDYDPNGIASVMTDFDLRDYKESNPNIKASLQDKTLWKEFHHIGTEMIITKCGRRMFPSLRVSVSGLDPNVKYVMLVNVEPVDDNRYKYHNCEWIVSGKAEAHFRGRAYRHPDSPLSGNQWMKQIISFHKLKLTNNPFDRSGHLVLNSMHKYVPVLHILSQGNVKTYNRICFNEAIFTAVTAYQNESVCIIYC